MVFSFVFVSLVLNIFCFSHSIPFLNMIPSIPNRRPCPVVSGLEDEEEGASTSFRHVSICPRSTEIDSSKRFSSAPCVMPSHQSNILHFMRSLNSPQIPRSVSMDLEVDLEARQAADDENEVRLATMRVQAIKRRLQPAIALSICKTCGVFVCQTCREHCCKGHTVFEHKFIGSPIARECGCKSRTSSLKNLSTEHHPQCCSRASLPRHPTMPSLAHLASDSSFNTPLHTTDIALDVSACQSDASSIEGQTNACQTPQLEEIACEPHKLQRMGYLTAQDVSCLKKPMSLTADAPANTCSCAIM